MPSRRDFIQTNGATCRNWNWSWAFVNHKSRTVLFGAWDTLTDSETALILDETWAVGPSGRKSPAYPEALEYINLVASKRYRLKTFPMIYSDRRKDDSGSGPAAIKGIIPKLTARKLAKVGRRWYATTGKAGPELPEEVAGPETYLEGTLKSVWVNAYERNRKARSACIRHYGAKCFVCDFDFAKYYGSIGLGLIHVHHLVSLAEIRKQYKLDPIADLRPVCANCHAIIHRVRPSLDVNELKQHVKNNRDA